MLCAKTDAIRGCLVSSSRRCAKLLLAAFLLTSATAALAIQEIEPNNTCALAQNVGPLTPNVTVTVNGALKTPPTVPDVDFYRFTGTPGDLLRMTLSGVSDGVDTLTLPLAEVLNSSCLITNTTGSFDPITFQVTIPTDGVVVLAVSSCCDFSFTGAGSYAGSYTLAVTDVVPVHSISGRAVDSVTAQPIPNVQAGLTLCGDPNCATVIQAEGFTSTDSLGQFTFTGNFGAPLPPGTYQVTLEDFQGRYETALSPPFSAASGQQTVVPDIAVTSIPVIGSIRGRIIDSVTHAPLSGVSPPHAFIQLFGCSLFSCSIVSGYTDSTGEFVFNRDQTGRGILANTYFSVYVSAEQYQVLFTNIVSGGAGVNQDVGDIQLVSNPVRFTVLQGCSNVPLTGGVCEYKVQITNGIARPVEGAAWATINANGLGSFVGSSLFQTGEPQQMYLAGATRTTRASRIASFEFEIPGTVPIYAFICPTFWFGTGDANPQLYAQGQMNDYTDCVQRTATGYTPATPDQIKGLRKEAHEHKAKERAMVLPK
jgi:hypothetical protein